MTLFGLRIPGRVLLLCLTVLLTGSCMRGCTSRRPPIHLNPNMDNQPKYRAQQASNFFYDGKAMRPPVEGTVARGELLEEATFTTGRTAAGEFVSSGPITVSEEWIERGRQRYQIYCTPCHGDRGNGQSVLLQRSGVRSADLHDPRIQQLPDGQLFDVITNGLGLMPAYRHPVPPRDRWAIIAYVRRLQQGEQR